MAGLRIPTYLSHSYRPEDQKCNSYFWEIFDQKGFYFSIDPPSDITSHTHLERMMNESSCYVAIVNARRASQRSGCSPFILSELGLSIQAQRPRLLLVDNRIADQEPFNQLHEEVLPFSANPLAADKKRLGTAIANLRKRALELPDPGHRKRGAIGILVAP